MNTCKTCRFWEEDYNYYGRETGKHFCDRVDCIPKDNIIFEIKASADDDSNLQAKLITNENFGCVLHEFK